MKGKKKDEQVDQTTLPEVHILVVSLNQLAKDANAKRTREAILKSKRQDFQWTTREEIKTFAKDKGLFAPADDKKKPPQPGTVDTLPKEATPAVMAEAFTLWVEETHLAKRVEKKETADAIAAGKPPPAAKKKEEKKKPDPKAKKAEEEVEEVEEVFPKDYDLAFVVEGYPETKEEVLALGKTRGGMDCLLSLELLFHHKKIDKPVEGAAGESGSPEPIPEADEKAEQDETLVPEIPEAKLTPEELEHVEAKRYLSRSLGVARLHSVPKSKIRNAVAAELKHEVIVEELDKTWEKVRDRFFKKLGEISLSRKEYTDWLKGVAVKPLLTPKAPPKPLEEHKEEPKKEEPKKEDKKKPDPKKDDKKVAEKKKEEESQVSLELSKVELPKEPSYLEAKELIRKMEEKLDVRLEYMRAVNTLDVFAEILDKHKADFEISKAAFNNTVHEGSRAETGEIDNFLDDIFNQVSAGSLGAQIKIPKSKEEEAREEAEKALKSYEIKGMYSFHDTIGLNKRGHGTFGKNPLEQLEISTFSHLHTPGVDRFGMPFIPQMSEQTRRYSLGRINAFHRLPEPELKRRLLLDEISSAVHTACPERQWNYFDRTIVENLDKDTFAQRYLEAKLSDPLEIRHYSSLSDALELALVDHGGKSFAETRVWDSPWAILPDYADWLEHFKTKPKNLSRKQFFSLDPQEFGPIQVQRTAFDLRNGGIVRVTDRLFKHTSHKEVRINYPELVAGIQPSFPSDDFKKLTKTEVIQRDLTPEEMEVYNPILKDKKKKRTKEEEDALIRTVKEEKIHEDRVYLPPEHSILWVSFRNLTRVLVENERVADLEKLSRLGAVLTKPLTEIFGVQAEGYYHRAVCTVSLPNGVTVKILPEGDILMKNFQPNSTCEEYRLLTGNGTVVCFLPKGEREILMASGNLLQFSQGTWISTNNKGYRKKLNLETGHEEELSPVPAAVNFSSVLLKFPITSSREDGVKIVRHENNDRVTTFKDDTRILTSERMQLVIVESPGLPPVRFYRGKVQEDAYRKTSPVVERIVVQALEGKYREIIFPDQSRGYVYQDKDSHLSQLLLETPEGGVFRASEDGQAELIPAKCRWEFKTLADNKARLAEKRELLVSRVDEIERTVGAMQEAMVNMSKAQPKGKKLTKKQLREEREKEEQKINDYQAEMKAKLKADLEEVDRRHGTEYSGSFAEYLNQLELPPADRACGVISFDINDRSLTTKEVEHRELKVWDRGDWEVIDNIQYDHKHFEEYFDLYAHAIPCSLNPVLLVWDTDRGYEMISLDQAHLFLKELEFNSRWRIQESAKVKGHEACRALTAIKACESLDSTIAKPEEIQRSMPRSDKVFTVEKLLKQDSTKVDQQSTYFMFRELWIFKAQQAEVTREFNSAQQEYAKWTVNSIPHENRFGYPTRFGDNAASELKSETDGWREALKTRQSQYSHDTLQELIKGSSQSILQALEEERLAEVERIRTRRAQMSLEEELLHRPKPDPYDEAKDLNLKAVSKILTDQEQHRKDKYEEELLRSISNKFVNNYFYTLSGIEFSKTHPSENYTKQKVDWKILAELEQLGIQTLKEQEQASKDKTLHSSLVSPTVELNQKASRDNFGQTKPQAESPEQQMKKSSFRIKNSSMMVSKVKLLEKEQLEQEQRNKQKILDTLAKMRMEYDIYGNKRAPLHPVFSMSKGTPFYELNENAITYEAATDKRIKTSSMSNRNYIHAPSIAEIRSEGMHQSLVKSMDKGNDHKDLLARKQIMPTCIRTDPREKDFVIYPHQVDFGTVRPGACYRAEMTLVNANPLLQRVKVMDPIEDKFKVVLSRTGPIAMGHERRVLVYFDAEHLESGTFETEFHILSKYRKYTIPIKAKIGPNVEATEKDLRKIQSSILPKEAKAAKKANLQSLFQIVEVKKEEIDVAKSKAAEVTGTITQDYLPKMVFDRNVEIRSDLPDPKKKGPIDYDADDRSGDEEDYMVSGKTGRP